jgi:hypothetical protein
LQIAAISSVLAIAGMVTRAGRVPARQSASQESNKQAARAAFEQLQQLEGKWHARSTRGWTDNFEMRKIARGTAVSMFSSAREPGSAMVTIFHLDGDRLLVSHYCEAGNHPRLAATLFEDGGHKVTFTFLDGTNLPSRDAGHMDKLVITFVDENHFTRQWTWYQKGAERWLEVIESERLTEAEAKP